MGNNAQPSNGVKFMVGDGATPTEAFAELAEVLDLEGPGFSRDTEETTSHGDSMKTYLGTVPDGGEVSFELNFDPNDTGHMGLISQIKGSGKPRNFQVVFPTTPLTTWGFAGIVTEFTPSAPVSGKLSASVTIKVSGDVDTAAGA
jgi:hypothetical protein